MNKTKKIVVAAVSVVMSGTMVASIAGCGPKITKPPVDDTIDILEYAEGTTVTTSIGYNSDTTAITIGDTMPLVNKDGSQATTSVKLPDGTTYQKGALKPIWQAYEDALKISINDKWTLADDNLQQCVTEGLNNYDLIGAGNTTTIATQINGGKLLDLSKYMNNMPNLRRFLDNNALAELSTLSNTETGAIYYAPYYGGMNDVERFNLFRKDYIAEFLDYANLSQASTKNGGTISFKAQIDAKKDKKLGNRQGNETYVGTQASVTPYMGTTGSWTVKTTNPEDTLKTIYVKVDYSAALDAAKNANSDLGKALTAAGVTNLSSLTSGNIVDLQGAAINATQGEVKGEHLLSILREYIKVAYKYAATEDASSWSQFYGAKVGNVTTKLSDVFNSSYAAWDVDLYAAIGRVFVTCGNLLGKYQAQTSEYTNYGASTWLLVPRTAMGNRTTRITAMVGELYGVRGMEKMTYLDSSGNFRQTRFNVSTWDALTRFSALHTEGLVPSFNTTTGKDEIPENGSSYNSAYFGNNYFQGLSSNDFIPSQSTFYGTKDETSSKYVETTEGYNWTCLVTPVAKWLTTDESTSSDSGAITSTNDVLLKDRPANKTTIMRFTESALTIKPGGLVIPAETAKDPDRLGATLALLDYMYSNDGLIETTFGTRSDTDNLTGSDSAGYETTNNGWWYGEPVKTLNIDGKETNIEKMSMEELYDKGVVTTYDNSRQFTMTEKYQGYALVYKNKLYKTGTQGGDYDNGYVYNGAMTPYYTRAVRKLILDAAPVNGYKLEKTGSDVTLKNVFLGQEGFGIVNNSSAVQLYNKMGVGGADVFSAALGNGSIQTVTQGIGDNPWYTSSPSVTLTGDAKNTVDNYKDFTTLFKSDSKTTNYFILEVGNYGANAGFGDFGTVTVTGDVSSPEKIVTYLKTIATQYENLNNAAWQELYQYYVNK